MSFRIGETHRRDHHKPLFLPLHGLDAKVEEQMRIHVRMLEQSKFGIMLSQSKVPIEHAFFFMQKGNLKKYKLKHNDYSKKNSTGHRKSTASNLVYFSLAVDESTDQTSVSQLCVLVFVCVIDKKNCVMEELLGMFPMMGQTTGNEFFSSLIHLCNAASLNMNNCVSITTDGAKSMIGTKTGMVMLLKERLSHCGVELSQLHCKRIYVVKD
ncbi:hypothetical protein TNIN_477551 [Trichonephila inaurata madagascariensis]|uniref:DUF4371 domain-containing protein n=1 Tax=Trichonephila inaurata madagascariensis TaxID=2747483 RepID=A0A8X7CGR4_9ARAC|nr:hypothetical protein TNIN_477551 [Trichonephila inaurata madagascariensis]